MSRPLSRHLGRRCHSAVLLSFSLFGTAAHAQLGDFLKKILPPSAAASAPATGSSTVSPLQGSATSVVAGDAPPVEPRAGIEAELRPDTECKQPQEKFNVVEKLTHYGGEAAVRRLQRLITTDFKYSDLTPQDKKMLDYIAKTTVWLPAEVESRLGGAFGGGSWPFGGGDRLSEMDQAAMKSLNERLASLKAGVSDFPAEIKLTLNKELADGAFAKFGGVIQLSERFLGNMTVKPESGDFVLAHELSHVYKRHAIKLLQFQLLSTSEGWELARKVLERAQRGMAVDPIADGAFALLVVPKLIDAVRSLQLKFNRDQELEADACSVVWLKAAGHDPVNSWAAFRASAAGTAGGAADSYEKLHPTNAERERRLQKKSASVSKPSRAAKPTAPVKPGTPTAKP